MADFPARYRAAFDEYLARRSESALGAAYELGRAAVKEGLGIMQLAEAHHEALQSKFGASRNGDVAAAEEFFRESVATFELAHRGYREAQETARLHEELARRQRLLAEAAIQINASLSAEEILRIVAEQACRLLDARVVRAEAKLERGREPIVILLGEDQTPEEAPAVGAPLTGRGGRSLGALQAWAPNDPARADEAVLVQLAQMASVGIENAQRYEREREIAQTLQNSLLPPSIPVIPGLDVAVRFRPAGDGIQVGGDFYDLFPTGPSEWAVVIGDVCGKGPDAAAVTALTRYTIRAATLHERRPSRILAMLNAAMLEQRRDNRFATVLYARVAFGRDGVKVVTASGGHPLPLIVHAGGGVHEFGAGGTLLGVFDHPSLVDSEAELGAGDTLVLYTDGVTEVRERGREVFGLDDLERLLAECAGLAPEPLLDRIERRVVDSAHGPPRDDVALLGLRVRE